jgi:hypothetical protein
MCSFQLPELLPLTSLRGVSCSTEPVYELEGEDSGGNWSAMSILCICDVQPQ